MLNHFGHVCQRRLPQRALAVLGLVLFAAIILAGAALADQGTAAARGKGSHKKPDLAVTKVSNLPRSAAPKDRVKLSASVKNKGKRKAKASKVRFYLSSDRRSSGSDTALGGKQSIKALKPGKQASVSSKPKLPAKAEGSFYLIACVDAVSGEGGKAKKNNCKASSKPAQIKPKEEPPDPTLPERFIGTTSATITNTAHNTGTTNGYPNTRPSSYVLTETLTARDVIFERVGSEGNYRYESTGTVSVPSLEWTVTGHSSDGRYSGYGDPGYTETCTFSGKSDLDGVEVGPMRETPYASGSILPDAGSLASGSLYRLASTYNFIALGNPPLKQEEHYTAACDTTAVDSPPHYEQLRSFQPSAWLAGELYRCSLNPGQYPAPFGVKSDGSLAGQDRCQTSSSTQYSNGNILTRETDSRWQWDLKPAGPA